MAMAEFKAFKTYSVCVYTGREPFARNDEVEVVIKMDTMDTPRPHNRVGYFKCERKFVQSELERRGFMSSKDTKEFIDHLSE